MRERDYLPFYASIAFVVLVLAAALYGANKKAVCPGTSVTARAFFDDCARHGGRNFDCRLNAETLGYCE